MSEKKLKVLILQPWISWRGAERTSVQLAVQLQKRGHGVKVAALFVDKRSLPPGADEVDYLLPAKVFRKLSQESNLFLFLAGPIILFFLIWRKSKGYHLLNPHNLPSHWIAVLVGRVRKIPVVWMVHNLPKKVSWKDKISIFEYLLWLIGASWFDKFLVRQVDLLLASSQRMQRQLKEWYDLDSEIIKYGVDYDLFSKGKAQKAIKKWKLEGKFVLLSARLIHPEKNQIALIKTLPALKKKIPEVFLVLAGEGPAKRECEDETERLKVSDRVLFTGLISRKDLRNLYAASDINLMPSLEEPLGLTPFEALSAGTISIISRKSGAAEVVGNQDIAVICEPTAKDINKKILEIYFNQDKYKKKARKGKLWVKKNISNEVFAERFLGLVKNSVLLG